MHNFPIANASETRTRIAAAPEHPQSDVRLGHIIRLLMDHATLVVSGTKIAQEIGTTRGEVWRLIEQLRRLGVNIAGHPSGYQLRAVPDLLLSEILAPMVHGTIFAAHIHHYYKIGSTNAAAMEAAIRGAPEGSVFLAEEQTDGRGRGSHSWHSARSAGIYCSVILRPQVPPADVLILSLAAGLAVQSAVEQIAGLRPDLKWPNDLLFEGKKFCGILTEMNAEATRVRHLVIGFGINVNHMSFPLDFEKEATFLERVTGSPCSRVELAAALLKSLDQEYRNLLKGSQGRDQILERFSQRSSFVRGRRVRVEENGGFEGVTDGLDAGGFLQVRTSQGLRTVLSGSIRPC